MKALNLNTLASREKGVGVRARIGPRFKPQPERRLNREAEYHEPGKPRDLVWDSVRYGKHARLYYYCKKVRIWSDAYRAVVGKMSYYTKFGLHIANADPHKWRDASGWINAAESANGTTPRGAGFVFGYHSARHAGAWMPADESRDAGLQHYHAMYSAYAVPDAGYDGHSVHGHHHSHHHESFHHGHHEHHAHHESGHGTHEGGHSEPHHFSWFFQSFWHMAGLNPYAVCVANHKAESHHAHDERHHEPPQHTHHAHHAHGQWHGHAEQHHDIRASGHHQDALAHRAAGSFLHHVKSAWHDLGSQEEHAHHENNVPETAATPRGHGNHATWHSAGLPAGLKEAMVHDAPRVESTHERESRVPIASVVISHAEPTPIPADAVRAPGNIVYILSRANRRVVSQLVVGAEALPE